MSLFYMAWRYLWNRWFVTLLTLMGIALGVALITATLTLRRETESSFLRDSNTWDLVVGAKGSPLQLVLNGVYHMDIPTGNIPYSRYLALKDDFRVTKAIPLGLGDNYRGFRIVGTTPEFFEVTHRGENDRPIFTLSEGRFFQDDFEAVVGASVARQTGLSLGDSFYGVHGLTPIPGSEVHDDFPYDVVGILAPSGTANDRAIFTTLESVWIVHEAEEELHRQMYGQPQRIDRPVSELVESDEVPENFRFFSEYAQRQQAEKELEVTSVLLRLRTAGLRFSMIDEIGRETESMAAAPIAEMLRLYQQILRPFERTLLALAYLVVLVSALSIMATLYQSAERRRRDLAIMRTLGARPREIFALVILESLFLTVLGILLGWILGKAGVIYLGGIIEQTRGLPIGFSAIDRQEIRAILLVFSIGLISGLIPAIIAYRRSPNVDLAESQ